MNAGVSEAGLPILSTVFLTVLATFSVLVGLLALQIFFYTMDRAAVGFGAIGTLAAAASMYLLYLLHWK